LLAGPSAALAQDLTLDQALDLARANNGVVRSAYLNYEASRSNARAARAAYYPTLTPLYRYDTSRLDTMTGPLQGIFNDVTSETSVTASWLLFDSGEREAGFRRSSYSRDQSERSALQTLRQILFSVHSRFYEALRSDELLRVRQSQLARAEEIEKQTKEFAAAGAGAMKDTLQATADALNAKASELAAKNRVTTARADLRAIIGLDSRDELPELTAPQEEQIEDVEYTLDHAFDQGFANRPDLAAQRFLVSSQIQSVRLTRLNSGLSWTLDARYDKAFSPSPFERSALVFQFTVPLFDGHRSRQNLRAAELGLDANRAVLEQSERDALAEIESAYKEFSQNIERLAASSAALDAAKINYAAVFAARQAGASELIELLTAQVSLVTAESNYVEARYDTLISRVRLKLATGRPMPGEGGP